MRRETADARCLAARDEFKRCAAIAHPRAWAFYRLGERFAEHESVAAHPAEIPLVLEDLRAIFRGARLIERRLVR